MVARTLVPAINVRALPASAREGPTGKRLRVAFRRHPTPDDTRLAAACGLDTTELDRAELAEHKARRRAAVNQPPRTTRRVTPSLVLAIVVIVISPIVISRSSRRSS
jgi:hypothetical protein